MITLVVLPLLVLYSPAAVWAFRSGGRRRLWIVCTGGILAIIACAVALGLLYDVPSVARVVLMFMAFCAPPLLLTSGLLLLRQPTDKPAGQLGIAVAGNILGLAVGWAMVVYGLQTW